MLILQEGCGQELVNWRRSGRQKAELWAFVIVQSRLADSVDLERDCTNNLQSLHSMTLAFRSKQDTRDALSNQVVSIFMVLE